MHCVSGKGLVVILTAAVVLVLLSSGPAVADGLVTGSPDFVYMSPEERQQELQRGLLEFLGKHPDLTSEQLLAIRNLADIADWQTFAAILDPNSREVLAERLGEVGQKLPYWDYLQLLRSFSDEFRVWLVENQLANTFEAATPECNCNDSEDCAGGACQNVTCIHVGGTSHDGRCEGTIEVQ